MLSFTLYNDNLANSLYLLKKFKKYLELWVCFN